MRFYSRFIDMGDVLVKFWWLCPGAVRVGPVLQGRRDSNPQPPVLETGALPFEPLPYERPGREGHPCDVTVYPAGTPKDG